MACIVMLMRSGEDTDGMAWSRGLPVDVLEYDCRLGESEHPALSDSFICLVLLDVDLDEAKKTLTTSYAEIDGPPDLECTRLLRAYRVHLDELPAVVLSQIGAYGFAEMTYAQVRPYIRHRITGECW